MMYPTISDNPRVQQFYEQCRAEGTSHMLAEMFALRTPPRADTDREFFEGVGTLDKQFDGVPEQLDSLVASAKQHGYTPGVNDFYNPALAEFPGDPKAFVPATGGKGHVKKVCEERNWDCAGAVTVKSNQSEPAADVALAPDLAVKMARRRATANPELRRMKKRDLCEEVISNHGART